MNLPNAIKRHKEHLEAMCGKRFKTKNSGDVIVLKYIDNRKILVKFINTGNCKSVSLSNLYKGEIQDKEAVSIYGLIFGVGFHGVGKYAKKTHSKIYDVWYSMLMRCYDAKAQLKCPTYMGCTVCSEWHNFQNFAAWYELHTMCDDAQIDKDIRIKGNKQYSPETCCMVPAFINKMLVKRKMCRGIAPLGVEFNKTLKKPYIARFRNKIGWKSYLGCYSTPQEAFLAYKTVKEKYIKHMATLYKSQMDDVAFQALLNYQVEITD